VIPKKANSHKEVSWWTDELPIMRKGLSALRCRYQRTRNNEDLQEQRRSRYLKGKERYASTIKTEKSFHGMSNAT